MDINPKVLMSFHWARDTFLAWLIIAAAIALSIYSPWFLPLSILIVGNRQHALALLGHEGTHKLIARNPAVNYWLSNLFNYAPLLIGWYGYRDYHFEHHRHLGTDRDPELPVKRQAGMTEPASPLAVARHFAADLCGLGVPHYAGSIRRTHEDDTLIYLLHYLVNLAALSAAAVFAWQAILIPLVWYVALATSFIAHVRLRSWYEHVGTTGTHKLARPNLVARHFLFPANAWLHHEHHDKPSVPYNKLPGIAEDNRTNVLAIHRAVRQL